MKRLIVVGAGGIGREIFRYAQDVASVNQEWQVGGFLDDNPKALDALEYDVPVIGGIKDYVPQADDLFVMGIGSPPRRKLEFAECLMKRGAEFVTLIHPNAIIGNHVRLGRGCVICPFALVTCDATLGDFVTLNAHATVGHDAVLGDGCTLSIYASVSGYGKLGKGVCLGNHGTVLPSMEVGDFAKVGSGSVVLRTVKPGTTVMGVPAKRI
jgi:sugar O-acyltransferase (sialic acid O-acetyltransferase NeuD family)